MAIQESGEMYLESIYILTARDGRARSIDVAEYLGVSRASVSQAMSNLKSGGYVTVSDDGTLILTSEGEQTALKMYERHTTISKMLTMLGVSEAVASEDACRIEHVISDESFNAIKNHFRNISVSDSDAN